MKKEYDIIIIGGGATGSGIAVDASLRGYKTLLIEKDDFASKSSSNSTKLVHGGVRYLEKAFLQLNIKQFLLVKEALKERYYFLNNCSNMSHKLSINSVLSNLFERFYLSIGLKLYDLLSFNKSLGKSQFLNSQETLHHFPFLNKKQQGSIGFFDGVFNDMKVNIALLKTAQNLGCDVYNYHEVTSFLYEDGKVSGLTIHDKYNHRMHSVKSAVIINSTGYYCDVIRKLDDETCQNVIAFSKGSHIILDKQFSNQQSGIIFQKTTDDRVLFILPWQNHTLVGTTEVVSKLQETYQISEVEINYLLKNINSHLNQMVTKKDILSHFSSIRPLLIDSNEVKSENIVREHLILHSSSNLISITGGKWTTYRKMGQDCLDYIIKHQLLSFKKECQTTKYTLYGNEKKINISQLDQYNLSVETKEHLLYHYGDKTFDLLKEFEEKKYLELFSTNYPFIKAELYYTMKYEFVLYPNDFLFRRIGIGKMNLKQTQRLLSKVVEMMAEYYNWDNTTTLQMYQNALKEINELLHAI